MDKIYGVVVLYNPNNKILKNISTYINQLDKLYIVDNSEYLNQEYLNEINNSKKIEYIYLNGNKGIAAALNIGLDKFLESKAELFLTMDQDSSFEEGEFQKYLTKVKLEKKNDEIGIFSPKHLLKEKKRVTKDKYVKRVMASGNILTRKVINKIGKFNEDFFIDEVDHEYCYRATRSGFKIKVFGDVFLRHNLGKMNKKIKMPKFLIPTNHNALRRYYITRNKLIVFKNFPEVRLKYCLTFINDFFKIIFYEDYKIEKIKMIIKAYKDYKKNIVGKFRREFEEEKC